MNERKNLVVFLDAVGRIIFGELNETETNEKYLAIYNPVLVNAQHNPNTGQMALQLIPVFFREFMAEKDAKVCWKYNRSVITETLNPIVFDFRLYAQYEQLFMTNPTPINKQIPQKQEADDNIIKLFDDETDKK